jgi:drug/metabolite transporter (DMT)-like permease
LVGIMLVVISAASFGTLASLGRFAYAAGLDTLTMMFIRFTLATVMLAVLLVLRREPLPRGPARWQLLGMGGLGYVGQAFCYLSALQYASAGLVALLLYLYPAFVALLSALWLHERLTRLKLAALGLALLGTALTVGPAGGQLRGVLLAIGGAVIYSVFILTGSHVMKTVSAIQSSTVIFAAASLSAGLLMLINGPHFPHSASGWLIMVAMAFIATVVPVATFLAGIERIGPTNASLLSTLEPAVTVLLAALLLGEQPQPLVLLGGALILAAVLLLTRQELRPASAPSTGR